MTQYVDRLSGEPARLRADYGTQACHSDISAVAVEAVMDNAREARLDDGTSEAVEEMERDGTIASFVFSIPGRHRAGGYSADLRTDSPT